MTKTLTHPNGVDHAFDASSLLVFIIIIRVKFNCRRSNFPFRKQAMPFLRHLENFSTGRESLSY